MTWLWVFVAILWLVMPLVAVFVLGEVYVRRWARCERRLVAYIERRLERSMTETWRARGLDAVGRQAWVVVTARPGRQCGCTYRRAGRRR